MKVLNLGLKREVERNMKLANLIFLCLFLSTSLHFSLARYIQNSDNIHIQLFIYSYKNV